jgi:hypothetical protein
MIASLEAEACRLPKPERHFGGHRVRVGLAANAVGSEQALGASHPPPRPFSHHLVIS